jgi:hypothetical protein|tara:strand:- start:12068 stop:12487 length:420 start_codon:yes stop_codon:yes gene_type:complete
MDTKVILKGILFLSALYHLIIGGAGLFFSNFAIVVSKYAFNFNMVMTDQIKWILKPFATYMFIFGILLIFASKDPKKNAMIVYGFVIFAFLRALQKTYFAIFADSSFFASHDVGMSIFNIVLLLVLGISTLLLYRNSYK